MDAATTTAIRQEAERQATSGNHQAALALLAILDRPAGDPTMAILRAKILSQQGDFARAAESWRQALAAEPGNDVAKRGLALTEALGQSWGGRFRLHLRRYAFVSLALVGAVALLWAALVGPALSGRRVAESLSRIERQQSSEMRALAIRTEASTQGLLRTMEERLAESRALMAAQVTTNGQTRDQVRILQGRVRELSQTIERLRQALDAQGKKDSR